MRHTARRNVRLRVLALTLPLALTFSAVRCGGSSGGNQTPTGPTTPTSTPVGSVSLTAAPPGYIAFIGTTIPANGHAPERGGNRAHRSHGHLELVERRGHFRFARGPHHGGRPGRGDDHRDL